MVDKTGNIYISDAANYRIRMITAPESTGINTQQVSAGMSIYPNPAAASFTLNIAAPHNTTAHISITNSAGQTIKTLEAPANKNVKVTLDTPPGIYLITTRIQSTTITRKLIIAQ